MRFIRALSTLALLASTPVLAEPAAADIAQLLQSMQERMSRLEARNAELEQRLPTAPAAALSARVEDVENVLLNLRKKPDPLEKFEGFSAGASLTMVAQRALGGTTTGKDESQANYRADVEVEMPAGSIGDAEGRIFAHFRLGQASGLTTLHPTLSSGMNDTAFQLGTGASDSTALLAQAWYQLDIPVGAAGGKLDRMEVTVGKIDTYGFFASNNLAGDETEMFLNNVFVYSPMLDSGGDAGLDDYGFAPGARLAYVSDVNGGNQWSASLGVFGSGSGAAFNGSFTRPLVIGQVEYSGRALAGRNGSYRLYAWNNGRALALDGITEEAHTGWGISLDQQVSDGLALFSRYDHSTRGEINFDRAFTLGGQLDGAAWGREKDRLGLALGWLKTSHAYQQANPGRTGAETLAELFYVWQANEQFHLSPSVQWITRPSGDAAAKNFSVLGLRAKFSY